MTLYLYISLLDHAQIDKKVCISLINWEIELGNVEVSLVFVVFMDDRLVSPFHQRLFVASVEENSSI